MKEATNFDGICLLVVDIFPLFSFLKGNSGYKYLKFFGSSGQIFFFFSKIFKHPNPEVGHWGASENPIRSLICIFRHLIAFKNVVPSSRAFAYQALVHKMCKSYRDFYWRDKTHKSWKISAVNLISNHKKNPPKQPTVTGLLSFFVSLFKIPVIICKYLLWWKLLLLDKESEFF